MKPRLILLISLTIITLSPVRGEEGMFPLPMLNRVPLKEAGITVPVDDIVRPDGTGLVNAIVKVGGCTGSFVSPDGLILTNHHCAFRAVQAASSTEHDYVRDGFTAASLSDEIPARGYTVRITESYEDVSDRVLSAVNPNMDPESRTRAIEQRIKELVRDAEAAHPGKRAEVSEMFLGKTYWLFLYTYIRDVRLVYVPPRTIGEFGGEADNWIWPRHTGDFSFMRAYVAPDGSPAAYSPENIPFHPKRHLVIDPAGVNEEDVVFILGYPGRTYRHRTAHFVSYQQEVYLPFVADWYEWQIRRMEEAGRKDRAEAIRLAARIKGLANTMKNYRGKLAGLRRLNLVARKKREELALQKFIQSDPERFAQYGTVLGDIGRLYQELRNRATHDLTLRYLTRSPAPLRVALTIVEAVTERAKPDLERRPNYMDRSFDQTRRYLKLLVASISPAVDRDILEAMLKRAVALPADQAIESLTPFLGEQPGDASIRAMADTTIADMKVNDWAFVASCLEMTPDQLDRVDAPFIKLARALYHDTEKLRKENRRRKGILDQLQARLLNVKQQFAGAAFIPDANSTLRLTYGHVRRYQPRDAVVYLPITTLDGVYEKSLLNGPYAISDHFRSLILATMASSRETPAFNIPVNILYDADTTGGNSGSPILNAKGNLVGVNFDRAYEATINDYAWSESYSRSIGVDIRYIRFILEKLARNTRLLKELGLSAD